MKPRAARTIDLKERIELLRTMQANVMADLTGEDSHYANYSHKLDLYMNSLFGMEDILKRSQVKPKEKAPLLEPLALYIEALTYDRPTQQAKDMLVHTAGRHRAYEIIKNTQAAMDNEHTMLDLLTEYVASYIETALEIPTPDKKVRLDTSFQTMSDMVGSKHARELADIVEERIDMELHDSLIAHSPRTSWESDLESRVPPKRGRKR